MHGKGRFPVLALGALIIILSPLTLGSIQRNAAFAQQIKTIAPAPVAQAPDFFTTFESLKSVGWSPSPVAGYDGGGHLMNLPQGQAASSNSQTYSYSLLEPKTLAILQEFRCNGFLGRTFQRGQRRIIVEVCRFVNPTGAYAAYCYLRVGASTVIVRGDGSSEDDQSVSFWKDRYFVRVQGTSEDDEECKEAVRGFADQLNAAIVSDARPPEILYRLPVLDRVKGSEKIVMGPNSATQFFAAPYLPVLNLEKTRAAATADYQLQEPYRERLKLLFADYGDPAVARQAYSNYVQILSANHDAKTDNDSVLPTRIFRLANGWMLCQLRTDKIIVIVGAHKRLSPIALARSIL